MTFKDFEEEFFTMTLGETRALILAFKKQITTPGGLAVGWSCSLAVLQSCGLAVELTKTKTKKF